MKIEEVIKTERFESAVHKAALNIMYTAYWFKTHMSGEFKKLDLTSEQFNVLRILKGKYPEKMCVKDIANRMIEKSSNVPRIIDRLLDKQLVNRAISEADRRETLIELTDAGLAILKTASATAKKIREDITGLTEQEAEQLNTLLEKMRKID